MQAEKMEMKNRLNYAICLNMKFDQNILEQAALTLWLFNQIDKTGKKYSVVNFELGINKNMQGKALASLWRGDRSHSYEDINRYSEYFGVPKHIIMIECERLLKLNYDSVVEYIRTRKTVPPSEREIIIKKIV